MDISSLIGILLGFTVIIGIGAFGGSPMLVLLQPQALLIVLGGTLAAMCLNFSMNTIKNAFNSAREIFLNPNDDLIIIINQMTELAYIARRESTLAMLDVLDRINDKFLRRGVQLTVDINDTQLLCEILTNEIRLDEEQELINSRVFEAMGGYSPTFGVIGAVLGLIEVMGNLQNTAELGHGIATAFVATFYGVGLANLVFIPIAGKLKMKLRERVLLKEMIAQGLISIQTGENPALIEEKLLSFLSFSRKYNGTEQRVGL